MLTAFALALVLQQAVVWEEPAQIVEPEPAPIVAAAQVELPDWAIADPFSWERSQCSPLVRGDVPLEICQTRVRADCRRRWETGCPRGCVRRASLCPARLRRTRAAPIPSNAAFRNDARRRP